MPEQSKINDGGSAFPSHGTMGEVCQEGMSLRDIFAAYAPIATEEDIQKVRTESSTVGRYKAIAILNYVYADEMLKERAKHE